MTAGPSTSTETTGAQVRIERVFDAPRELVWRAWTEPEMFMRWYGPTHMTTYRCEIDLRVGGSRVIGMRSLDGQEYDSTGVFLEVEPPAQFVATETPVGMDDAPETTVTVTLEALADGKTKVVVTQAGLPSEQWATGAGQGWNQALDKLVGILDRARLSAE
ncbi:MAG TPA: SRPBCC domain-containing protein [Candidatus Limnocylindrales bacterium]|nr:SRPBCC domain-containing protein [Candidatus Limnocylindrales bacterium]